MFVVTMERSFVTIFSFDVLLSASKAGAANDKAAKAKTVACENLIDN